MASYQNPFVGPANGAGSHMHQTLNGHNASSTSAWAGRSKAEAISDWAHEASRLAAQSAFKRQRSSSAVHKPVRDKSRRKQQQQQKRTVRGAGAGLTINTNLASQKGPIVIVEKKQQPGFIDLASLQAADVQKTPAVAGVWMSRGKPGRDRSRDLQTTAPAQPRGLEPQSSQPYDTLSPEDRHIPIGLSLPSNTLPIHRQPTEQDSSHLMHGHGSDRGDAASMAPTIVITPARERSGWSPLDPDFGSQGRPRARSSFYSQVSPLAGGSPDADAPPVPNLPQHSYYHSKQGKETSPKSVKADQNRQTGSSVFTDWYDTPTSAGSRTRHLDRSSVDTSSPSRRSKGWWNTILSPFLTRSNTLSERQEPVVDENAPDVPILPYSAAMSNERGFADEKAGHGPFSPVSPESGRDRSSQMTTWSGLSEWEDDRTVVDLDAKDPVLCKGEDHALERRLSLPRSLRAGAMPVTTGGHAATTATGSNNPFLRSQTSGLPPLQTNQGGQQSNSTLGVTHTSPNDAFSPNDREVPVLFDTSSLRDSSAQPQHTASRNVTNVENVTVHHANVVTYTRAIAAPEPAHTTPTRRPAATPFPVSPPQESSPPSTGPPPYSPPPPGSQFRRYHAILPPNPHRSVTYLQPHSPGPVSPGMQRAMTSDGRVPMSEISHPPPAPPASSQCLPRTLRRQANPQDIDFEFRPTGRRLPITLRDVEDASSASKRAEAKRQRGEKEDAFFKKLGGLWRGRGPFGSKNRFSHGGNDARRRRRKFAGVMIGVIVLIFIIILTLVLTLTRKSSPKMPSGPQAQFLNLTTFPPIPTGLSTVVQPDIVLENTGCVFPSTAWSCSLPKESQSPSTPSNQPPLQFSIAFLNDTAQLTNTTSPLLAKLSPRHLLPRSLPQAFTPSPAAPSLDDIRFLSSTTDGISSPLKEGEPTPFYLSLLAPSPPSLSKRQSDPFPNIPALLPPPALLPNSNLPQAATLFPSPLPASQPLRLFDRGLPSEHYGFYTYYDRAIFLSSVAPLNASASATSDEDAHGGARASHALMRCTWAQTRLLVQIWTRKGGVAMLRNGSSSAGDNSRPGTFPLPISVTVDRHGGDVRKKMVYCYDIDAGTHEVVGGDEGKKLQVEDRGFGGNLVGGGQGPLGAKVGADEGGMGGIDGGTGGCGCGWRNFVDS